MKNLILGIVILFTLYGCNPIHNLNTSSNKNISKANNHLIPKEINIGERRLYHIREVYSKYYNGELTYYSKKTKQLITGVIELTEQGKEKIRVRSEVKRGQKDGWEIKQRKCGNELAPMSIYHYKNKRKDGKYEIYKVYCDDNRVSLKYLVGEGQYKHGFKDGDQYYYNRKGKMTSHKKCEGKICRSVQNGKVY